MGGNDECLGAEGIVLGDAGVQQPSFDFLELWGKDFFPPLDDADRGTRGKHAQGGGFEIGVAALVEVSQSLSLLHPWCFR